MRIKRLLLHKQQTFTKILKHNIIFCVLKLFKKNRNRV